MTKVRLYGPDAVLFGTSRKLSADNFGTACRIAAVLSKERNIVVQIHAEDSEAIYRWKNGYFRIRYPS